MIGGISDIFEFVEKEHGVTKEAILSKSKLGEISHARQIAMYLARDRLSFSYPQLGMIFNRDHSTVQHGYEKIRGLVSSDDLDAYTLKKSKTKSQTLSKSLDGGFKIYKKRFLKCWEEDPFGFMMEINAIIDKRLKK